ncbi:YtxH domain-containing protein [Flavobacterium sp. 25HG05S-40]|uniref:YtxH domain-containing protein n=1 Tax=Flavobacterium sp. 25HG05S-40 TaxID=3458682 RepID=UPI0040442AFB
MRSSNDALKVVGALVIGAAAGAALGILFAPKKGSETRQDIADNAKKMTKNLKNKFQGQVDDLKDQVAKAEKFLEENMSDMKDTAEDKWANAKNNIDHKLDNVKDAVKS